MQMDKEIELSRKGSWKKLLNFYDKKRESAWQCAWIYAFKDHDIPNATKSFVAALQDPAHKEAAFIMLRWLGQNSGLMPQHLPKSLKLFLCRHL